MYLHDIDINSKELRDYLSKFILYNKSPNKKEMG